MLKLWRYGLIGSGKVLLDCRFDTAHREQFKPPHKKKPSITIFIGHQE